MSITRTVSRMLYRPLSRPSLTRTAYNAHPIATHLGHALASTHAAHAVRRGTATLASLSTQGTHDTVHPLAITACTRSAYCRSLSGLRSIHDDSKVAPEQGDGTGVSEDTAPTSPAPTPSADEVSRAFPPPTGATLTPGEKLYLAFTCSVCETRATKIISKDSYEHGVVLIRCDGCQNNHLIADHLGWFGDTPSTVESILQEKGESVARFKDGVLEFDE